MLGWRFSVSESVCLHSKHRTRTGLSSVASQESIDGGLFILSRAPPLLVKRHHYLICRFE